MILKVTESCYAYVFRDCFSKVTQILFKTLNQLINNPTRQRSSQRSAPLKNEKTCIAYLGCRFLPTQIFHSTIFASAIFNLQLKKRVSSNWIFWCAKTEDAVGQHSHSLNFSQKTPFPSCRKFRGLIFEKRLEFDFLALRNFGSP